MLKMETNNTKGAVEFCKDLKEVAFKYGGIEYDLTPHLDNIIILLEEGDKHKKIVDELESKYQYYFVKDAFKHIKQKHFPKTEPKKEGILSNKIKKEIEEITEKHFIEKLEQRFRKFIKEITEEIE